MNEERKHLGTIVKNLEPLHNLEYKVVFNIAENTFFQKLVSKEVLDKVRIRPKDYLKSLLFLDYFSRVVANDYAVCDNLENISKAIRDKEREEEQKTGKDSGESGASYLSLETAVYETGLWAKERDLTIAKCKKKQIGAPIKQRYNHDKVVDLKSKDLRELDLFYEGIGEMVVQQLSDKIKKYSLGVSGRADIGALIFTDSVLTYLKDKTLANKILQDLENKKYYEASISALNSLAAEASLDNIKSSLENNHA